MNKKYFPALIIIIGMVLSHLFFTLMVYRSNLHLHHNLLLVIQAGYLPVPNEHILPSLEQVGTALKGAFFYTLTAGIVLPFFVYLAAWAWDRGYRRKRPFLIMLSGFVIFYMVMVNRHGFNPIITFWFLTVYMTVFKLTLYSLENAQTHLSPKRLLTHVIVLAVVLGAWTVVPTGSNFFLSVRDHLLLSNSFGQRITDFYYQYTPYPTEAYKELLKKNQKTCRMDGNLDADMLQRVQKILLQYDCLPIDTEEKTDVEIRALKGTLSFFVDGRGVLKTDIEDFLAKPYTSLRRMSLRSDRNEFTRKLLAFSLICGLPLFLYAVLFGLFQLALSRVSNRSVSFSASAGGCLAVGIGALILFKTIAPASVTLSQISAALESDDTDTRVAALRTISNKGLDPTLYMPDAFSNIGSDVPERIWWAISLANSTDQRANETLLQLIDDPHPLVACKALSSLGRKGYRPAVSVILQKIKTSRHWYVQGYAYQALRSLGWKQNTSS